MKEGGKIVGTKSLSELTQEDMGILKKAYRLKERTLRKRVDEAELQVLVMLVEIERGDF